MSPRLELLGAVPPFTRDLASKDEVKWSAKFGVPAIGSEITIRINGIGRAKVTGYAVLEGYLGVMAVPLDPPPWWLQQNGKPTERRPALVFGAEIQAPPSPTAPVDPVVPAAPVTREARHDHE